MARIRTIKPEFYRHEGLQDLEIANPGKYPMMVFSGLWGHCDKAGRFEWRPRQLKLDILPFLPFDMAETMGILEAAGFLRQYEVDGRRYGVIDTLSDHQRFSGKEAQEPVKHPAPPENKQGSNGEAMGKHLGTQEGKGREGEDSDADASGAEAPPDLKTRIFTDGLSWLAEHTGKSPDKLRPALGRCCSKYGDATVIEVIAAAQREAPVDPLAWMEAAFQARAGPGRNGARKAPIQPGEIV